MRFVRVVAGAVALWMAIPVAAHALDSTFIAQINGAMAKMMSAMAIQALR